MSKVCCGTPPTPRRPQEEPLLGRGAGVGTAPGESGEDEMVRFCKERGDIIVFKGIRPDGEQRRF